MAKGRAVTIVLEGAEKSELTALTRKHGAPRALAERARFVLAAAAAAQQQGDRGRGECLCRNGRHMGNRFAESRMDGLYDEPRPGAPREIGDDEIATTIRKTLEMLPKGATHWSLRTMVMEIGHATLDRTSHLASLRAAAAPRRGLQALVRSVVRGEGRDIVGLYLSPPEHAVVLCVGEIPGASTRPHAAGAVDAARPSRTTHA
jgi:hypothetical protein